jgi:MFS superfamily sulfate permease-like transporter
VEDWLALVPGTLAIVIIGYSESISIARQFADEHRYEIKPDRELTALGSSGILAGLFQGFIAGGGASQSAANDRAGATTQMAGVVLALLAALTSIALMPLFKNLPLAVLAAIVINAVLGFLNVAGLRRVFDLRRDSFYLALVALAGVLVLGILPGMLIAVALTILLLLSRLSRPAAAKLVRDPESGATVSAQRNPGLEPEPGLLVFRLDAPLLFVNASWMRDSLQSGIEQENEPPRVVVLDMELSPELDLTGLAALETVHRDLQEKGQELWLANVHGKVRDLLEKGGLTKVIGEDRIYRTLDVAYADFLSQRAGPPAPVPRS